MNLPLTQLLSEHTLEGLSSYLVGIVLLISILMSGCRRIETMIRLFVIQSLSLVSIMFIIGSINQSPHTSIVCAIIFLSKCILIPAILMFVLKQIQINREIETYISLPVSMLINCAIAALIFETIPQFGIEKELHVLSSGLLSTSISVILIGLFIMMTRKKALTQIIGLYVMENGIFALTINTIFEMPYVVEMGILLDLLIGALVMGVWVYRIRQSFETINVEELTNLRG
ncbi:MAG: hypothetical protein HYY52_07345 [Candidatus Melainabacteria bacterium]|nr:hypothetical protein [Candidatus Melainabacteria bacterium]